MGSEEEFICIVHSHMACPDCVDDFRKTEKYLDKANELIETQMETNILVRKYLEQRGIRERGTVGRTMVLPALDKVIAAASLYLGKSNGK